MDTKRSFRSFRAIPIIPICPTVSSTVNLSMAKVFAPFPVIGTFDGLTFYMMMGENIVRPKSSLTRERVKRDPNFALTRHYAGLMGRASKVGSAVYQGLPKHWRQHWMYQSFTGEAGYLLQAGKTEEEAIAILWKIYVEEIRSKRYEVGSMKSEKRQYRKADSEYWIKKAARKEKINAWKEKLARK